MTEQFVATSKRKNVRIKWVWRSDGLRTFRICRMMWERGTVGDGDGYSVKLSLALRARLFAFRRASPAWDVTLAGIRVHYTRSYGGTFV